MPSVFQVATLIEKMIELCDTYLLEPTFGVKAVILPQTYNESDVIKICEGIRP